MLRESLNAAITVFFEGFRTEIFVVVVKKRIELFSLAAHEGSSDQQSTKSRDSSPVDQVNGRRMNTGGIQQIWGSAMKEN